MKKVMSTGAALFLVFAMYVPSHAEESPSDTTLDEVVVTATRTNTNLKKVGGASVTVITQDEILAKQQTTVGEVLKGTPGLDITSNGGIGTSTSIFMRGADSKNTLVLVDGIMFNDPSTTDRRSDIANITTDNIERIEIVRGPMSVLYGSNATAGVINIITKKGTGTPKTTIGAEGGSYDTWKVSAGNSGAFNRLTYSLNFSYLNNNGFSTANDDNNDIPHAGNTSEDDGYENTSVSGKGNYEITPRFDLSATMRYMDSEVDEDDFGNGYTGDRFTSSWPPTADPLGNKKMHTDSEQYLGRIAAKNTLFDELLHSETYYQITRHDRQSYDNDGNKSYDYLGKSQEGGWQGTFAVSDSNDLTLGVSLFEEKMESQSSDIDHEDADIKSIWIQEQLMFFDNINLVAGVRYDDHDRFGDKTTYRVAPSYFTDFGTLLKASYATGFRAPSLFELYSSYGNEDLDAEKSKGWDIGFEQEVTEVSLLFGITYFSLTFEDRIGGYFDLSTFTFKYKQFDGKTKTKGVETFVQWQPIEDLTFRADYTYTDTEDPDGKRLTRRPMNKFSLNTQYRYKKTLLNLDIKWVDERDTDTFELDSNGDLVNNLDAYTLVNLAARYDLNDTIQIYGRIDNLFDEEYEEVWSYATPGLSGYAGIKMTF